MKAKKHAGSFGLQFIVVLIIFILFSVIYIVWLDGFRIFGENLTDYTICKNSNLAVAADKISFLGASFSSQSENKCKTEYVTVKKGKETETIAKKMAQCWDEYLEGKHDLFKESDDNFCAFCSVLEFENKETISGKDFSDYLIKNKVKSKGQTYFEYLTRLSVTEDNIEIQQNKELSSVKLIDTSNRLAVLYVSGKDVHPGSLTGTSSLETAGAGVGIGTVAGIGLCSTGIGCVVGAFLIGGGIGYLIGSDDDPNLDNRVLIWPYTNDELKKLKCTQLEGRDTLEIRK